MPYAYDLYNAIDNGKLNVVPQLTYFNSASIAAASTVTLTTAPGTFGSVVINSPGIMNFSVLDGGTLIANVTATGSFLFPAAIPYNARVTTGLAVTVSSLAGSFTLLYR